MATSRQKNPAETPEKAPKKADQIPQQTEAESQLAQRDAGGEDNLEAQAKDEAKQRDEELKASKTSAAMKAAAKVQPAEGGTPAGARAGHHAHADTQGGFMDQMSARSAADVFEGHFVTIDMNAKGVEDAYKAVRGFTDDDGNLTHTGNYGVYVEPQLRDPETGIPLTAAVRLRDETNALVVVPYEALSRAESRGR